jgi:hypothetical protein
MYNIQTIKSAYDFFKIVHEIKLSMRFGTSSIEFYRGHSNKEWGLIPSLFRWTFKENNPCPVRLASFEKDLIDEFSLKRPDEFPPSLNAFDKIAKMQHYNMHTRLLDITSNPAVALYFACSEYYSKGNL